MTSLGWQILAFAIGALQALGQVAPPLPQDDAGSGADAPDDPLEAIEIQAGAYAGNLTPPDDADWYVLPGKLRESACFEARTTAVALANVTMALAPSLAPSATQRAWPGIEATVALATPNPQGVWFGVAPAASPVVGEVAGGTYAFELLRYGHGDLGAGDAGTGGDAGADVEHALPAPIGCFGGRLDAGAGDLLDVYTFEADDGDVATLSLANGVNGGTVLQLVSPSGEKVQSLSPGNVTAVALDEGGLWKMELSHHAHTPGEYLVALSLDRSGPPEEPCRPTCMGW